MKTNTRVTTQDWREYRRQRVWEMHEQGYKQQAIAGALGLSQGGVSHIIARGKAGGVEALRYRKPAGAKSKLTVEQKQELLDKLEQGAENFKFSGDVWTTKRIARMIEEEFGVKYHSDYIGPLLRSLGWSRQRPIVRAKQRDEEAIRHWMEERWPELKKKPVLKDTRFSL